MFIAGTPFDTLTESRARSTVELVGEFTYGGGGGRNGNGGCIGLLGCGGAIGLKGAVSGAAPPLQ